MPATPAWPPKSLPRLFVAHPLSDDAEVALNPAQSNYLQNVLRMTAGAQLLLFDGISGEWLARIGASGKKRAVVSVERKIRDPEDIPDVWLAFSPVKRGQTDWLVEKATELGAARLIPVMTDRTIPGRVRVDRLRSIAIEAAEQCGRTRVPQIDEPVPLRRFVEERNTARHLYFADESGGEPVATAFRGGPAVLFVGPEGGFTEDERVFVRGSGACAISLGPRILRAETAALAALSAYMALAGDWR